MQALKNCRKSIALLIVPVIWIALIIEVVNPHSYLLQDGAMLRVAVIAVAIPAWLWMSWRKLDWLFTLVLLTLIIAGLLYCDYALRELCYNNSSFLSAEDISDGISLSEDCPKVFRQMMSNE